MIDMKMIEDDAEGRLLPRERSEIMDRLKVMKAQEVTTYLCSDYLENLPKSSDNIDEWCRLKMIGWCFQVIDYISFRRETVIIAISYLDRFLSAGSPRAKSVMHSRKEYQLAAMTTLYMAIKLFEPTIITTTLLSQLSKGGYSPSDFLQMEVDILFGVKWLLNGPTAMTFLEMYHNLMPSSIAGITNDKIMQHARYQIELSTSDYKLVNQNPSNVAIAAMVQSVKKITSAPELTLSRPKLMKTIENLTGVSGYSASIRQISKIMERCDRMPIIQSRRHIDATMSQTIKRHGTSKLHGSHSSSPRGISN
jgi:hypothetical protein